MEQRENRRAQQTRERLRNAARKLFLQQGYLATSIDAILVEAGVSSRETLYRYYAGKEELFTDVLRHLTLEQPGISEKLLDLPAPHDLPSLRERLTMLAREIMTMMNQPEYLALVRITVAEAPRFPQLGSLFFSAVPQRGFSIITTMLRAAREQEIIADVDFEAVTLALLGGMLTYAIANLMLVNTERQPPPLDRADALVEVIMHALTPQQ